MNDTDDHALQLARECGAYQGTLTVIEIDARNAAQAEQYDAADLRMELEGIARRAALMLLRYK